MPDKTFVLNFGHGLAPGVVAKLDPCVEIRVAFPYIGRGEATSHLVAKAVTEAERRMERYGVALDGSVPVVVILPGTTEGGVVLVAEIAGRLGYLPRIVMLRKTADRTYELYGGSMESAMIDLERIKKEGRWRRSYRPTQPNRKEVIDERPIG